VHQQENYKCALYTVKTKMSLKEMSNGSSLGGVMHELAVSSTLSDQQQTRPEDRKSLASRTNECQKSDVKKCFTRFFYF